MPRASKSGVKGLFRMVRLVHPETGERVSDATAKALTAAGVKVREVERWTIDLRYDRREDDGRMVADRYQETLPDGLTAATAKTKARDILNKAEAGTLRPDAVAPVRLHRALDLYLEWARTNRPKAHRSRGSIVSRIKAGMPDMALDTLSPFAIERYKAERKRSPKQRSAPRDLPPGEAPPTVGPATINREVAVIKHFAGLAASGALPGVALSLVGVAAIRGVKMLKEPAVRVRSLKPNEERGILAALSDRVRLIAQVADLSGMRRAEVARLRRDQVNLAAGEITLTLTKSNEPRSLPMNGELRAALVRAMEEAGGEYLFPSPRKGPSGEARPYSLDAISRAFHKATIKAGVRDLRFHDLRHDHATKLRRSGVGIDVIQKLLGHADIQTTSRYAHVEPNLLRAAVDTLPAMQAPTAAEVQAARARRGKGAAAIREGRVGGA